MSVQLVLTADNHLDPPAIMYGPKRYERKLDYIRSFDFMVDYALKNRPDLLLVAGDLFHHVQPRNPTRALVMDRFRALYEKGIKVFLISGHHDTPKSTEQGMSPLAVYGQSGYVTYFQESSQLTSATLSVKGIKVVVSGISYNPTLNGDADPMKGIKPAQFGDVNVLMLHYPIQGFEGYYGHEPTVQPESLPEKLQLVTAGHLHKHQRSRIKGIEVIYPGSTERVNFQEEEEEKGFVWLEMDKAGVSSQSFIKTPARRLQTLEFRLPKEGDINSLLKKELLKLEDPELVLRLKLRGTVNVKQLATYRRSEILALAQDRFFALFPDEREMEIETAGPVEPLPRTTPMEEVRRYFQERLKGAGEEEKPLILEALQLCERRLQEAGAW
ncbi:MAG: DNA repair exonuclease [Candidatus Bathyarchaeia archaeon]